MPKKKPGERPYLDYAENPFVAAAAFGVSAAIVGLTYAAMTATPERRRALRERMEAERRYRRELKKQAQLRHRLRKEYFEEGEGKALYEREAYVVIPRGRPYPDATFEVTLGGLGFEAISESTGLRLSLSYDFRDAMPSIHMSRRGGSSYYGLGGIIDGALRISPAHPAEPSHFDRWIEDTRPMAGLISAPGSTVESIWLRRPDELEINCRLWEEHLRENPDVAAAIGEAPRASRR